MISFLYTSFRFRTHTQSKAAAGLPHSALRKTLHKLKPCVQPVAATLSPAAAAALHPIYLAMGPEVSCYLLLWGKCTLQAASSTPNIPALPKDTGLGGSWEKEQCQSSVVFVWCMVPALCHGKGSSEKALPSHHNQAMQLNQPHHAAQPPAVLHGVNSWTGVMMWANTPHLLPPTPPSPNNLMWCCLASWERAVRGEALQWARTANTDGFQHASSFAFDSSVSSAREDLQGKLKGKRCALGSIFQTHAGRLEQHGGLLSLAKSKEPRV